MMEELADSISDTETTVADLTDGIKALDKDVATATEQRKEEHADYLETIQLTETGVQLMEKAKNRLQKFYNPSLYKAPPKKEMSMEDKILSAGTSALTQSEASFDSDDDITAPAPDALFAQVRAHHSRVAP